MKTRSAVSNGCVRMLNAHVQQLYDHVEVGMAVEICVDPQRLLASLLFIDLLKDLAGSLILELVGEVSSYRFRVG